MITKRTIRRIINEYNRDRSPIAEASLIGTKRNRILLRVSGSFCGKGNDNVYFEGLRDALKRQSGQPVSIKEIKDKGACSFTAIFSVTPMVG